MQLISFLALTSDKWLSWFGNFHFIFVHFPIALIIMACVAELIFWWKKNPQYNFIVSFLLISAALLMIPTILSGLSLEESGAVNENAQSLLEWHESFAFTTLSLIIVTLFARHYLKKRSLYLWCLFALLIAVIITSHLGGLMVFDNFNLLPPLFN